MKRRNILIVMLLLIGISGMFATDCYIRPAKVKAEEKYAREQLVPETHDIENALKYKNKYMGNFSNLAGLSGNLPLAEIERTYELKPKRFEFIQNYKVESRTIGKKVLQKSMLYDAVVYFALIDNLEIVSYNFKDYCFSINKAEVKKLFNKEIPKLLTKEVWRQQIQERIRNKRFVENFWINKQ